MILGPMLQGGRQTGIEAGFFSGYWPYSPGPFYTGAVPYYTLNAGDGTGQGFDSADQIAPGTALGIFSWTAGINATAAFAHIGAVGFNLGYYTVTQPAQNFAQGEVHGSTRTRMGGGNGEIMNGYWSPDAANWYLWGYFSAACQDAPYWLQLNNQQYQFTDGGYGP